MSFLSRRRNPARAVFAALILAAAGATPAAAADLKQELTGVYAGPVGPGAEIRPTPTTDPWTGGRCGRPANSAGEYDSVVPRAATAGSSTDQCIAFFLRAPDAPSVGASAQSPDLSAATGDDAKDVTIDLPSGFAAQPKGIPVCSAAQFRINEDGTVPTQGVNVRATEIDNTCPAGSLVGKARIQVYINSDTLKIVDDSVVGGVYNLSPAPGEVARLGIEVKVPNLYYPVRSVAKFRITGGANPRLQAVVQDLPRTAYQLGPVGPVNNPNEFRTLTPRPLIISGVGILAWGNKTEHPELATPTFAQHGTQCGVDLSATASVTTYKGTKSTMSSTPYRVSGCEALPFAPTVTVKDVVNQPGAPTPVTVDVDIPQAASEPRTALVKDVSVTLPAGLEVGAQVASGEAGLPLCSAAAFNVGSETAATCPAGSKVGEAQIDSPLVDSTFKGNVYLGPQAAVGELPKLYVEASLDGLAAADAARIKLVGSASVGADGRVTAVFNDNPQLRFNHIKLAFRGGANALFISPRTCGTTTGSSSITPSNGAPAVTAPIELKIDADCAIPAFAPSVAVSPSNPQAKATSPSTISIARPDRSAWLSSVKVSLPSGLLAFLKNAAECPSASAAAGNCGADSRIGTVKVTAGAGGSPLALSGSLYLVQPPAGAVAGAVIVVRAKIGDLDLGDVVVPGRIELRATDAGLDFITTAPSRIFNLALNLRSIDVALDRDAFATNPSSCGPLPYGSVITSDTGDTASPGGTVSYTGCAALPFQPSLRATLTGDVKPLGYPGMYVEVNARPGDTNLRSTTVVLPEGVSAATQNLQNRCELSTFAAYGCAANTKVGTATANVSITDEAIVGDIFLLKVPGESLPGLGLSFSGRYTQRVTSTVRIAKDGRLTVIFDSIPDLPLTRLVVDVKGGSAGPLRLQDADCAIGTRWDATFAGQGGQNATAQTGLRCASASSMRLSAKTGFSLRNFDFGGRKLQSAKVTIPAGYKLSPSAAKPKGRAWVRVKGGTAKMRITSKSITITSTAKNLTDLRVKISSKAVVRTSKKKLKKGATVNVKVRFAYTDGGVQTQTVKASAG